jgi:DNA-binding response OmpR family regulator
MAGEDGVAAGKQDQSGRAVEEGVRPETGELDPRLLLVDDDPDIVRMVSKALRDIGWQVSTCSDAAKASECIANEQPNAVLLDIYLEPPASGWRVLQELRDDVNTRDVPVIVFSSQIRELEEKEAWLLENHISVLSKPFELEDLYDAVEEFQGPRRPTGSTTNTGRAHVDAE